MFESQRWDREFQHIHVRPLYGGYLMALKVGDVAPDFKLGSATGETQGEFQLSSQKGKNVVLFFYALDFTPV